MKDKLRGYIERKFLLYPKTAAIAEFREGI